MNAKRILAVLLTLALLLTPAASGSAQEPALTPAPLLPGEGDALTPAPLPEGEGDALTPLPLGEGPGVRAMPLSSAFTYQGQLKSSGVPVHGACDFQFSLWDDDTIGYQVGETLSKSSVSVDRGIFTVSLDFGAAAFAGDARWLDISVRCPAGAGSYTPLLPRQPLTAGPYAVFAAGAPWAGLSGVPAGFADGVDNNTTYSAGAGLSLVGNQFRVSFAGSGVATTAARSDHAHADYFDVTKNETVTGRPAFNGGDAANPPFSVDSTARVPNLNADLLDGQHAAAFAGAAHNHIGQTWATTEGSSPLVITGTFNTGLYNAPLVLGNTWYAGHGLVLDLPGNNRSAIDVVTAYGGMDIDSVTNNGIFVESAGNAGVWVSEAGTYGFRVDTAGHEGLYADSVGGDGVYVGTAGKNALYAGTVNNYGVYVGSAGRDGIYADTTRATHNYGFNTPDNLYSLNYHLAGAVMHLAQNGSAEDLEPGDVVIFSGLGQSLEKDGTPMIQVARATTANSTAVAGVVFSRYDLAAAQPNPDSPPDVSQEVTPAGPIPPGSHLLIVIQGPAQVKANALAGAIRPGDLLSSADQAGLAGKAAEVIIGSVKFAAPGTVFGKALETLETGAQLIYVFVTLQ